MTRKLYALLEPSDLPLVARRTRHYVGSPEAVDGVEGQVDLPTPSFLVLLQTEEGVYLDRYTKTGDRCGDTWHTSVQEALEQAEYEYGERLGEWQVVPESESEAVDFVMARLKSYKSS